MSNITDAYKLEKKNILRLSMCEIDHVLRHRCEVDELHNVNRVSALFRKDKEDAQICDWAVKALYNCGALITKRNCMCPHEFVECVQQLLLGCGVGHMNAGFILSALESQLGQRVRKHPKHKSLCNIDVGFNSDIASELLGPSKDAMENYINMVDSRFAAYQVNSALYKAYAPFIYLAEYLRNK